MFQKEHTGTWCTSRDDLGSFLDHFIFVTKTAQLELYQDLPFAEYDKFVVDRVLNEQATTFLPNDSLLFSSHFHAATINLEKQVEPLSTAQGSRDGGWAIGQSLTF